MRGENDDDWMTRVEIFYKTIVGSCRLLLLVVIQLVRIVGRIVVGKKWLGLDVVEKSGMLELLLKLPLLK
uniref:Uncharacterized protein n=1 Tax=Tanacetum cinerariifolium TaxID=118510 RepID=A0A699QNW6_TANCI|nr:hypothetical protein [Tanacetum cinerariifolium]